MWYRLLNRRGGSARESCVCVFAAVCSCQWWRDNAQLQIPGYLGVALLPTLEPFDTFRRFYSRISTTNANTIDTMLGSSQPFFLHRCFRRRHGTLSVCISFKYLHVLRSINCIQMGSGTRRLELEATLRFEKILFLLKQKPNDWKVVINDLFKFRLTWV